MYKNRNNEVVSICSRIKKEIKMNENFEFRETPYFTWKDEPATDKQKIAILDMWEFNPYPLPTLNLKTLTKGEWIDYMNKYYFLAHENVNSPTFGY